VELNELNMATSLDYWLCHHVKVYRVQHACLLFISPCAV